MAADALAPRVMRTSAAILLTIQNKKVLGFHEEGFEVPAPYQFWEIIVKNIFMLLKKKKQIQFGKSKNSTALIDVSINIFARSAQV